MASNGELVIMSTNFVFLFRIWKMATAANNAVFPSPVPIYRAKFYFH